MCFELSNDTTSSKKKKKKSPKLVLRTKTRKLNLFQDISALFSAVGGILGLYLGLSLLVFAELVQLVAHVLLWYIRKWTSGRLFDFMVLAALRWWS